MKQLTRFRNWWNDLPGHQRISLSFDFVIMLATTTYAVIAIGQLCSMNTTSAQTKTLAEQSVRQANAAATQAAISGKQATILQRQLDNSEAAQRAHLVIEDFKVDTSRGPAETTHHLSFTLRNVGASVAEEIATMSRSGIDLGPVGKLGAEAAIRRANPQPNEQGWSLAAGDKRLIDDNRRYSEGNQVYDSILKGTFGLQFQIVAAYRDIFGNPRIVSDCVSYDSAVQKFVPCGHARHHD